MSINEIFRTAKGEINAEIKRMIKQYRQEILQKDKIIKDLKCQIAVLTQASHKPNKKPRKPRSRNKQQYTPDELRRIRDQRGLTQKKMAQFLGFSTPAYCGWECGRNTPRVSSYKAITAFTKLSDDGFLEKFALLFPGEKLPKQK